MFVVKQDFAPFLRGDVVSFEGSSGVDAVSRLDPTRAGTLPSELVRELPRDERDVVLFNVQVPAQHEVVCRAGGKRVLLVVADREIFFFPPARARPVEADALQRYPAKSKKRLNERCSVAADEHDEVALTLTSKPKKEGKPSPALIFSFDEPQDRDAALEVIAKSLAVSKWAARQIADGTFLRHTPDKVDRAAAAVAAHVDDVNGRLAALRESSQEPGASTETVYGAAKVFSSLAKTLQEFGAPESLASLRTGTLPADADRRVRVVADRAYELCQWRLAQLHALVDGSAPGGARDVARAGKLVKALLLDPLMPSGVVEPSPSSSSSSGPPLDEQMAVARQRLASLDGALAQANRRAKVAEAAEAEDKAAAARLEGELEEAALAKLRGIVDAAANEDKAHLRELLAAV